MNIIYSPNGTSYKIKNQIGCGVFGEVFSAITPSGNLVAIKITNSKNGICLNDFKQEAYILNRCIDIPYTVKVEDMFYNNDEFYIVMPFYSHIAINVDPQQIAVWFYQILCALKNLHDKGYVHGDIKYDNIMVNINEQIVLIDFGISIPIGSSERDIVSHVYKTKKRLKKMITLMENNEEIERFPEAEPFDDLYALGFTMLYILGGKNFFRTKMIKYDKEYFENVLKENEKIPFKEIIQDIVTKKCKNNFELANFFKESLIYIFVEEEVSISLIMEQMFSKYFDIISFI